MTIAKGTIDEERFNLIKDRTILDYKNFNQDQPYQHAMYNVNYMSRSLRWHNDDKLDAIQNDINLNALKSFAPILLSKSKVEVMIHGNMSSSEATSLIEGLESSVGMRALRCGQLAPLQRCVEFPIGHSTYRRCGPDPENPESVSVEKIVILCNYIFQKLIPNSIYSHLYFSLLYLSLHLLIAILLLLGFECIFSN